MNETNRPTHPQLLASSSSLPGLARRVDEYFAGGGWTIDPETLRILRPDGEPAAYGCRVIRKARRYRFEAVEPA